MNGGNVRSLSVYWPDCEHCLGSDVRSADGWTSKCLFGCHGAERHVRWNRWTLIFNFSPFQSLDARAHRRSHIAVPLLCRSRWRGDNEG